MKLPVPVLAHVGFTILFKGRRITLGAVGDDSIFRYPSSVMDPLDEEEWGRQTREAEIRGVSATKPVGGDWRVAIWLLAGIREEPLRSEVCRQVERALQSVEGVTGVRPDSQGAWVVSGTPTGEGLMTAAAEVVDGLVERTQVAYEH